MTRYISDSPDNNTSYDNNSSYDNTSDTNSDTNSDENNNDMTPLEQKYILYQEATTSDPSESIENGNSSNSSYNYDY